MSTEQPGNKTAENQNDQIISYLTLRVLIGATGVLLPLLVVIGKFISDFADIYKHIAFSSPSHCKELRGTKQSNLLNVYVHLVR